MPWELLSGPDLGGGFLFQLTHEPLGPRARLVYHAQEGGIDASGPPKGSPVPLGFVRTSTFCEIGGRECYHRTFELEPARLPTARLAYNRLRFVTAPMLEQEYGGAEVPLRAALTEIAARLAVPFAERPDAWFVGGAAAAWLQGAAIRPRSIDLGTDVEGVDAIATALGDALIEPLADTTWPELGPVHGARAYVGTLRSGVRVRWGRRPGGPAPGPADLAVDPRDVPTRPVGLGDTALRASRPEFGLVAAAARGDRAEATAIATAVRALGADRPLAERLLAASAVPGSTRERVLTSIGPPSGAGLG